MTRGSEGRMAESGVQAGGALRAGVLAAAALLLLAGLGAVDAWAPDEPRYLQVAEELRQSPRGASDWVLLRLDGEVYDQKPPLYFGLAALAGAPFGRVGEAAARLPSALSGLALIALTLALGTRLFGGRVGVLGAALLLTTFEFARNARRVQLDVLLALLEATALFLYWRIDRGIGARGLQLAGLHAALGLAVLTKGPVGLLVPLLVIAVHLAWERRLRELPRLLPPWALLLSLGPGLLWLAAASALAPSGFASDMLGPNLLGRFFSGTSHARPFHYFLYVLPIDFLPWTLLWPLVLVQGRALFRGAGDAGSAGDARDASGGEAGRRRRAWRFLLAWVGASFVFFSLSSGKRGIYLLPVFPALALLCADALVRTLAGRPRLPTALAAAAGVLAALLASVGVELALAAATGRSPLLALASLEAWRDARLELLVRPLLLAFACALLGVTALTVVAWVVLRRHRAPPLLQVAAGVAGVAAVQLAVFLLLFPALDPLRSPRPIARAAAAATPAGSSVGLVHDRALRGGLVYYGGRPVTLLREPEEIRAFLRDGGRALVVKRRKLERVSAVAPVRVLAGFRAGRREVLVVTPGSGPDPLPAEKAGRPAPDGAGHGAVRRRSAP